MKKVAGYILSIAGLASIGLSVESIKKLVPISLPERITPLILTTFGLLLILIGIIILLKKSKPINTSEEIPIYQGNKIVGYRRH